MICQHLLLIHRRIRVARESAIGGQCKVAHRLMKTAGRDFTRAKADGASTTNGCVGALANGTAEFLKESRRLLRTQCPGRGSR